MSRKGWLTGWAMSLSAVAMVMGPMSAPVSASAATGSLGSDALRSALVRVDEEPPGSVIQPALTLAQIAAAGGLGQTPGMTSSPPSCLGFVADALPQLGSMVGWMQFGAHPQNVDGTVQSRHFIQLAADLPGGAKVGRFREAVEPCRQGTLTVEGRVTAAVTFTVQHGVHMKAAHVFAITESVTFPSLNAQDTALITKYGFHPGTCGSTFVFVGIGDVLLWSLDSELTSAVRAATIMHDRALQALRA